MAAEPTGTLEALGRISGAQVMSSALPSSQSGANSARKRLKAHIDVSPLSVLVFPKGNTGMEGSL